MGVEAFQTRDDGTRDRPGDDAPWSAWVSATRTRNTCNDDPLLDWLDAHGETKGFVRDDRDAAYDERADFSLFQRRRGQAFEEAVVAHLASRFDLTTVCVSPAETRESAATERTWEAMVAGREWIAQAPLWNPERRTYGVADLLVRSDVLHGLFPHLLKEDEARTPARDVPGAAWHYRVVDVKYTTLRLARDGHALKKHLSYMAQLRVYNEALGRVQGWTAPSAYVLGRGWAQGTKDRGTGALDRLARVDHDHRVDGARDLEGVVTTAVDWIREVRRHGGAWDALPVPSDERLRPNLRNKEDQPWHGARARIADALEDLTLVPRVGPTGRARAMAAGITTWRDPACTAEACGVGGTRTSVEVDAVLAANRSPSDGAIVFPERVTASEALWREPAPAEFYVDFENVSDLDDDFRGFPAKSGQPLIFMVGCGHVDDAGEWAFRVFTADRLVETEERRVLDAWKEHLEDQCRQRGCSLSEARLYHWSPAEREMLEEAYNSAAERHGETAWSGLPFVDLWEHVAKAQPVAVRGAFGFGLKPIAKSMRAHGLIDTTWGDGPADGLGAMAGAWWCDAEAARRGAPMRELGLMRDIERYNEVDCRVVWEVLRYLRKHR